LVVLIILKIPYLAFRPFLSGEIGYFFALFLEALTSVLGIYVIPLVFITKEKIFPVVSGLRCLWQNFHFSLPFVCLTILIVIINKLSQVFVLSSLQNNHAAIFTVACIQNIFLNYIVLSVFMTSTMLLLNKPDLKKYLQP
jgi:O-antigen/teichoic acid export membrane protein